MKNNIMLSLPTAKIQIGNQAAITLDTATTNGKKSFQINIVTENDSINKEIESIVEEVSSEIKNNMESDINELTTHTIQSTENKKLEIIENMTTMIFPLIIIILPLIVVFSYYAYYQKQKRLWKETLLNKGFSLEEINRSENEKKLKIESGTDELASYDKRKTLKYAIVFGSLGISILIGTIMGEFGYFIGMLFILLGSGFWYYNEKIK